MGRRSGSVRRAPELAGAAGTRGSVRRGRELADSADFTNRLQFREAIESQSPVGSTQVVNLASIPLLRESAPADHFGWQAVGVCEPVLALLLLILAAPALIVSA